ncbi:MAG: U32 family peptidase [Victivallaceae bacterium]
MKKMELLAPAGGAAQAMAAFEAGADAIYAGLSKFNARERSENFTPESMGQVIEYARRNQRKVYVTFNTVIKEKELPEAVEMLAVLADLGPDALIVQDLGVVRVVREYFPQLTLHGSTQMNFHNSAGLEVAAKLGLKRVILERQVTLDEIALMKEKTNLEIELFVHGALCCSLSGQCLFSSWLGGASGNRGRCKQPCRRRFFSKNGNGFFFSPQDLCMIDQLDELRKMGIDSLKIEGRLRQSDYVANVVSAYRLMLDAPADADRGKLLGEARNLLSRSCGRKWSHGFYTPESAKTLISHENLGAAGQLCGTVDELRDNGFRFITGKKIHLGDRLRVQPVSGDEGPALTVTKMFVNNQDTRKAHIGDAVFICCDKPAPYRGLVFKIGESSPDYSARLAALPKPRKKLALDISISQSAIRVAVRNAPCPDWSKSWSLAEAKQHALNEKTVAEAFAMADSEVFAAGEIKCEIEGALFCPAAELKAARREFWDMVKATVPPEAVFSESSLGLERFRRACAMLAAAPLDGQLLPETILLRPGGETPAKRQTIRANSVYELNKLSNEAVLPDFCPETKIPSLTRAIEAAFKSGIRRFRTPALYGLAMLAKYPEVTVTAGGALPVCNSMAVAELAALGVSKVLAHVELERDAVIALREHSVLPLELYRFGRPALLVTRAVIPAEGDFRDARGNEFTVRHDHRDNLTRIFPARIVSVPRLPGLSDFYDITNANWDARDTVTFNFETELL